jgi:hypothetical protein
VRKFRSSSCILREPVGHLAAPAAHLITGRMRPVFAAGAIAINKHSY